MTLTIFPYNFKDYKYPTREFLNFLTHIAKELDYDINDSSWDHDDPNECRDRWDAGGNWAHKKIIGKIINQSYGYDYIGEKCPGLVEVSDQWDDGLDLKDFKNRGLLRFKYNKKTHEITITN